MGAIVQFLSDGSVILWQNNYDITILTQGMEGPPNAVPIALMYPNGGQNVFVVDGEEDQILIHDGTNFIAVDSSALMDTSITDELDSLYVHKGAFNAAGDLLVGGANDTYITLPVGTDGHILVADSDEISGAKWSNTPGNLVIGTPGTTFDESSSTAGVYLGFGTGNTARVVLATGTVGQNWEIDNLADVLRFYKPGAIYATLSSVGLSITGFAHVTSTLTTSSPTGGVGYRTGAGGTVTQGTNITTAVTIDKVCGSIVTVTAPSIAAGAEAEFTVNNSTVVATDVVLVSMKAQFTDGVVIPYVKSTAAGSFVLGLTNVGSAAVSAGAATINFALQRAVTS